MKHFVLYDSSAKVYAGLTGGTITAQETPDTAVIFDERDNMPLKARFYNTVTGMNFQPIEV